MRTASELVELIRTMCKERNTSLTKLEEMFSWANGTIGKWAKGKRYPGLDKLQMISNYFNISVDELTGEYKEKPAAPEGDELADTLIIGRDGKAIKRRYSKAQMDALWQVIQVMPYESEDGEF